MVPITVLGFGAISLGVVAFRFLRHKLANDGADGVECSIGFPDIVAVVLLTYDVVMSGGLTALFVYLLLQARRDVAHATSGDIGVIEGSSATPTPKRMSRVGSLAASLKECWKCRGGQVRVEEFHPIQEPVIEESGVVATMDEGVAEFLSWDFSAASPPDSLQLPTKPQKDRVMNLIWRTLIGACLFCVPFTINLAILVTLGGLEKSWTCFIVCTLDSTSNDNSIPVHVLVRC